MIGNLLDIETAEVLRGPQGTLFGRNTAVGALNLTTRDPSDEFEGYVSRLRHSMRRCPICVFEDFLQHVRVDGAIRKVSRLNRAAVSNHSSDFVSIHRCVRRA